jgi:hypothetical protein
MNKYIILLWEALGEESLGIPRNKLENIKMDLRKIHSEDRRGE